MGELRWRYLFVSCMWCAAWVAVTLVALTIGIVVASYVAGRM